MNEETNTILDQLSNWNERLIGLPSGVMIFLFVALASFVLRWWKLFPDRYVAPSCTFGGMVIFCLLAPYDQVHMRIWLTKNAILGFMISGLASTAILKFGHKLPFVGGLLQNGNGYPTAFLSKSDVGEKSKQKENE